MTSGDRRVVWALAVGLASAVMLSCLDIPPATPCLRECSWDASDCAVKTEQELNSADACLSVAGACVALCDPQSDCQKTCTVDAIECLRGGLRAMRDGAACVPDVVSCSTDCIERLESEF